MGRNECGKSKGFFVSYCWCCCCSYGHGSSRSRRRRRDLPPPPSRPSLCVSACCFVSSNATMEIINRIDALCSFFTLSFPFFPAASPKEGPPTNLRTALSPFLPILFTLSLSLYLLQRTEDDVLVRQQITGHRAGLLSRSCQRFHSWWFLCSQRADRRQ